MDLELKDTGSGGDIIKKERDLNVIFGFQNMPYLAWFGGNPGFITPQNRPENEQAFDWWGNSLFLRENKNAQFNSLTEEALRTVALNSFGASVIEKSAKKDLSFMADFADITVEVTILSDDKVELKAIIAQPDNEQNKEFIFIWDATKLETTEEIPMNGGNKLGWILFDGTWDDEGIWIDTEEWQDA